MAIGLLRTTADPESGRLRRGESMQLCDPFVEKAWKVIVPRRFSGKIILRKGKLREGRSQRSHNNGTKFEETDKPK